LDEIIPSMSSNAPIPKIPLAEISIGITPSEERLIRAIDWLCIDESTHITAIVTVNQLLRLFLNNGRINAARTLLFDVPSDVIEKIGLLEEAGDEDLQATEFVHWRSFFDALDHHLRFVELWNRRPAENAPSRLDKLNWTKALNGVVDDAQVVIRQVLEMDWIKLSLQTLDVQTGLRLEELTRIRRIYIPELVFRLHSMLYETSSILPQTLASVIQLPNLVADENHKLYLDFIAGDDNRLPEYLEMVRIAEMSSLGQNPDPFYLSANTHLRIGQSA
jgi:nuclear pore complex protein Nup107